MTRFCRPNALFTSILLAIAGAAVVALPQPASAAALPGPIRSLLADNRCLDAYWNNGPVNGARVQIWSCTGNTNQQWYTRESDWHPGYFQIVNVWSGKCLNADNSANLPPGAKLQLWDCLPVDGNAVWSFAGSNYDDAVLFPAAKPGFVMDADISGGDVDGMKVQLWNYRNLAANQRWWCGVCLNPEPA